MPDTGVFSTGEVARICRVSPPTVIKWVDEGRLEGYRIPGSTARRIPVESLRRFLTAYGLTTATLDLALPARVLLVDDDPSILALLRDFLESENRRYEVRSAANAFEAGALTSEWTPQVILLDLRLPDIDGYQVLKSLRRNAKTLATRVIAISAADDRRTRMAARRAGFDDFFPKPFDLRRLSSRLDELCGGVSVPAAARERRRNGN